MRVRHLTKQTHHDHQVPWILYRVEVVCGLLENRTLPVLPGSRWSGCCWANSKWRGGAWHKRPLFPPETRLFSKPLVANGVNPVAGEERPRGGSHLPVLFHRPRFARIDVPVMTCRRSSMLQRDAKIGRARVLLRPNKGPENRVEPAISLLPIGPHGGIMDTHVAAPPAALPLQVADDWWSPSLDVMQQPTKGSLPTTIDTQLIAEVTAFRYIQKTDALSPRALHCAGHVGLLIPSTTVVHRVAGTCTSFHHEIAGRSKVRPLLVWHDDDLWHGMQLCMNSR